MLLFLCVFQLSIYGAMSDLLKIFDFRNTENEPKNVDQISKDSMDKERTLSS